MNPATGVVFSYVPRPGAEEQIYHIRPALLKSKQYYNNAFRTAVSYDALMSLKQVLIVHGKFSDLN